MIAGQRYVRRPGYNINMCVALSIYPHYEGVWVALP
jgi:hypothetical protein